MDKISYQNIEQITIGRIPGEGLALYGFARGFVTPTKFQNPAEHEKKFRAQTALPEGWRWRSAQTLTGNRCEILIAGPQGEILRPELIPVAIQAAKASNPVQDKLVAWLESKRASHPD